MMNLELLLAKDAIFRLIGQFHRATRFDDGELYIYNMKEFQQKFIMMFLKKIMNVGKE